MIVVELSNVAHREQQAKDLRRKDTKNPKVHKCKGGISEKAWLSMRKHKF